MTNCLRFIDKNLELNLRELKDKELDKFLEMKNPEIRIKTFIKYLEKFTKKIEEKGEEEKIIVLINFNKTYSLGYLEKEQVNLLNKSSEKIKIPYKTLKSKIHSLWIPRF